MKENIVESKSLDFAVRCVNLYKYLNSEKKEYILSKQLVRSGTSIGANIKEAIRGQSNADFLSKMSISLKEANETEYWLTLLTKTNYITDFQSQSMIDDCNELIALLISITKTAKQNIEKQKTNNK
ncbi:MAG: four helix bundle protein [Paludibacteraceae bacterium]|nr:four helix bundle protein [Paludibacteraceae bacterium]